MICVESFEWGKDLSLPEVKEEQEESTGGERQSWVKFYQTKVINWIVSVVVKFIIHRDFEGCWKVNWNFFYNKLRQTLAANPSQKSTEKVNWNSVFTVWPSDVWNTGVRSWTHCGLPKLWNMGAPEAPVLSGLLQYLSAEDRGKWEAFGIKSPLYLI